MSTKLTGYVWDGCAASGMKLSSVAIMARLADFSNDEGVCWPSIETIARQIGAGMSTVRTAIARLEAEGWLTRKARRQGMRSWTIKGKPASGRAVLSQEQDGIKSHTHSASVSSTDLGTKTTSSFDYGTKSTNNTGAHTHSVSGTAASAGNHTHSVTGASAVSQWSQNGSVHKVVSAASVNTSAAGAHTHSVSGTAASAGAHAHTVGIGAHTHSVSIGSHGHTITVNAAGNAENTVKNIAFNYIVRLA